MTIASSTNVNANGCWPPLVKTLSTMLKTSIEEEEADYGDLDSEGVSEDTGEEEVGLDAIDIDDSDAYNEMNDIPTEEMFDEDNLNEEEA